MSWKKNCPIDIVWRQSNLSSEREKGNQWLSHDEKRTTTPFKKKFSVFERVCHSFRTLVAHTSLVVKSGILRMSALWKVGLCVWGRWWMAVGDCRRMWVDAMCGDGVPSLSLITQQSRQSQKKWPLKTLGPLEKTASGNLNFEKTNLGIPEFQLKTYLLNLNQSQIGYSFFKCKFTLGFYLFYLVYK